MKEQKVQSVDHLTQRREMNDDKSRDKPNLKIESNSMTMNEIMR